MLTLTSTGIQKQVNRLKNSINHATYMLGSVQHTAAIAKIESTASTIQIFVLLDDTVTGTISNISIVDNDGDVIAVSARQFVKPALRGLYSVFTYNFTEAEGTDI